MPGTRIFIAALSAALFYGVAAASAEDFATLSFDQKLKLARAGDRDAQSAVALAYEKGTQTKADKLEAAKWYRKAADQGNIEAQFKLARIVSEDLPGLKKNPELAAKLYESAARQGHHEAQNWLGYSYQHGIGIARSDASAAEWYRKAADSGLAVAQNNLGLMYLNGKGVPRDYAKAFTLFEQAAKQGDAWALNNLGGLYEMGWGVPRDRERALGNYQQAFAKGNRDAGRNLKRLSANQESEAPAARLGMEGRSKPVAPKPKPPIVESKTKTDEARKAAGEPAKPVIAKAKSTTTEAVLSAPPLPRSKPKALARKSLAPREKKQNTVPSSKSAKGNAGEADVAPQGEGQPVGPDSGTKEKASGLVKKPAAPKQGYLSPPKSGEDCRPRAFRSYVAGRMRPCDYW